ncbi:MAG: septation protein A [Methylococcales bacterium]|jgi:intracellular septation protein|nr:septation protein A [Methylococcales bacterium]MBT7444920.1 septation protein A [Methylococcales bacterium]
MNKFLFDFFPALLFFASNKFYQTIFGEPGAEIDRVLFATKVFIVATVAQVAVHWWKHHEVKKIHIITLVLVLIFGGMTIYIQDKLFLQWKVSIINWVFALAFIGSQFIGEKTLIERMLGANIDMPMTIWIRLNLSWAAFFIAVGFINLYVFMNYGWDTWMDFKLFGLMGLTIGFAFVSILSVSKYIEEKPEATDS